MEIKKGRDDEQNSKSNEDKGEDNSRIAFIK